LEIYVKVRPLERESEGELKTKRSRVSYILFMPLKWSFWDYWLVWRTVWLFDIGSGKW